MKENKLSIILGIILVIMIVSCIFTYISQSSKNEFVKPEFDKNIKEGLPNIDDINEKKVDAYGRYSFYINPSPVLNDNRLLINFTSFKDNNVWLKLRVYCSSKKIGETGLIKANEYLEEIEIEECDDAKISYEVMSYQIDTYFSEGVVKLNTTLSK